MITSNEDLMARRGRIYGPRSALAMAAAAILAFGASAFAENAPPDSDPPVVIESIEIEVRSPGDGAPVDLLGGPGAAGGRAERPDRPSRPDRPNRPRRGARGDIDGGPGGGPSRGPGGVRPGEIAIERVERALEEARRSGNRQQVERLEQIRERIERARAAIGGRAGDTRDDARVADDDRPRRRADRRGRARAGAGSGDRADARADDRPGDRVDAGDRRARSRRPGGSGPSLDAIRSDLRAAAARLRSTGRGDAAARVEALAERLGDITREVRSRRGADGPSRGDAPRAPRARRDDGSRRGPDDSPRRSDVRDRDRDRERGFGSMPGAGPMPPGLPGVPRGDARGRDGGAAPRPMPMPMPMPGPGAGPLGGPDVSDDFRRDMLERRIEETRRRLEELRRQLLRERGLEEGDSIRRRPDRTDDPRNDARDDEGRRPRIRQIRDVRTVRALGSTDVPPTSPAPASGTSGS